MHEWGEREIAKRMRRIAGVMGGRLCDPGGRGAATPGQGRSRAALFWMLCRAIALLIPGPFDRSIPFGCLSEVEFLPAAVESRGVNAEDGGSFFEVAGGGYHGADVLVFDGLEGEAAAEVHLGSGLDVV